MHQKHEDIANIQRQIDAIDMEIEKLLNKRGEFAAQVGDLKRQHDLPLRDPERQKIIIENLITSNTGPLTDDDIKAIFHMIVKVCFELQKG